MKFTFTTNRSALLSALSTVSPAVPTKTSKEILKNILLTLFQGKITLCATNEEVGIRSALQVDSKDQGQILLTRQFGQILKELDCDDVTIVVNGTNISIDSGTGGKFRLQSPEVEHFPSVPEFEGTDFYTVDSKEFSRAIRSVVFCCDEGSTRYTLGGVCVIVRDGKMTLAATDSRRLGFTSLACATNGQPVSSGGTDTTIPAAAMKLVAAAFPDDKAVDVRILPSSVLLRCDGCVIYARLVVGRFPQYEQVIPSDFQTTATSICGQMQKAIRQVLITTADDSEGVTFDFSEGNLELKSAAADVGDSEVTIPIAIDGEDVAPELNAKLIVQFFSAHDPVTPVTIKLVDKDTTLMWLIGDATYLSMPLATE